MGLTIEQIEQALENFKDSAKGYQTELEDANTAYEDKVKCVTKTIREAIDVQNNKLGFGSSYGYGYGMSPGPRSGQRQRMVGYSSPSRRAPRARGTTAKRRRSPMMY